MRVNIIKLTIFYIVVHTRIQTWLVYTSKIVGQGSTHTSTELNYRKVPGGFRSNLDLHKRK